MRIVRQSLVMGAFLFLTNAGEAWSQVGGLINKRLPKAVPGATNQATPPQFDDVTLEITTERIDKLLAAKQAAKRLADAPTGPAALRQKADQLDARQTEIYSKYVDRINAWDEKRRDIERCRGDSLSAIRDRKDASGPQDMQKMQQLALAVAMAQQKGDTAEVRRLTEQFQKSREPTAADSAAVNKRCGDPAPLGVIKEWADLKDQIDNLRNQASSSEAQIEKTENTLSGMNARQRAMSCERIKKYIEQLRKKQAWAGFSDAEIKAMQAREQAIKDLEALCP